jgi:hypothetical protein
VPTPRELLSRLTASTFSHCDRAIAVLWLMSESDPNASLSASELADAIEGAGYGSQNRSRLAKQLDGDRRVVKRSGAYALNVKAREAVHESVRDLLGPVLPTPSDSLLPLELFFDTRGYIERVVRQTNAAYDHALFDCAAVMLRRLIETLIIEVYEHEKREGEIKRADGNYPFLSQLVSAIKADSKIGLSRNTERALESVKALGDLSAHNRRYNAVQNDLDRVRDDARIAAQELLVLAGMR